MSSIMREDWVECELGEVCNFVGGGTPSKSNSEYWNGDIPWASIKDIKGDYLEKTQNFITESGLKESASNMALENEIILATRINPGKPIISRIKTAINQDLKIVKHSSFVDIKFLFFNFKNLEKKVLKLSSGTTVLGINLNNLSSLEFPLAPLPIQRAIVSKIEALFSDLDNGIANFKKAQAQLKIYRQAVLKKAFEGELTKEWRVKTQSLASQGKAEPLPTAQELLKQIKEERQNHYNQQVDDWKKAVKEWEKNGKKGSKPSKPKKFIELSQLTENEINEKPKLPTGWKWERIGNNFLSLDQGWSPKCENLPAQIGEWGVIKTTAVQANSFEEINNKKLPSKLIPRIQHELIKGDILITRAGPRSRVGVCCLVNNVRSKLINCDKVYRIKAIVTNPTYLVYLLNSPEFSRELEKTKSGISDSGVNLKQDIFLKLIIPLCSLTEQHQIVAEIESRLSVCDNLEFVIRNSIEKAEALRQSILKKAFEGRLLSEAEVNACKAAADYEPASELLIKILAERVTTQCIASHSHSKKKSKE
ncbi:MAG: restriction endonuclease subunit S [Bacteroidales bacterium]|nr:restriction endonuclease subunit S [Bacteroidales bacterium]